ncbi:hypothetical protein HanIR_Chr05g0254351 [Helianthus annuus]|nr:hypothetical protein HanIR_Chr05g0254351 [Helianthus annuus]
MFFRFLIYTYGTPHIADNFGRTSSVKYRSHSLTNLDMKPECYTVVVATN